MNLAVIKSHRILVAGKWNELSEDQLLRVMNVFLTPDATPEFIETRLVATLLQLWRRPKLAGVLRTMDLENVAELRRLTQAFLQAPVKLTKQLIPRLDPGPLAWPRHYYGPGDMLAGVNFTEWIAAENAYFRYRQGDAAQLLRLVAILYRPGGPRQENGDRREAYSQFRVEDRMLQLSARLKPEVAQAVLYYYNSCRTQKIAANPDLFPGKEYADDPDPVATNPTRNYQLLLRELAGTPDRFDLIGQQPVDNVFFDLNERVAESHAQQKALADQSHG